MWLWLFLLALSSQYHSSPVEVAGGYLGIHEKEKGFSDTRFEKKMRERGWRAGQNWCAYFVWLVLDESKNKVTKRSALARGYITKESIPAKRVLAGAKIPANSLIIWQRGSTVFGHIGFVEKQVGKKFFTIEGNTDDAVRKKIRTIQPLNYFRITHFTEVL